jgi:hypothetical protein
MLLKSLKDTSNSYNIQPAILETLQTDLHQLKENQQKSFE